VESSENRHRAQQQQHEILIFNTTRLGCSRFLLAFAFFAAAAALTSRGVKGDR
jgi:hypothetical protein